MRLSTKSLNLFENLLLQHNIIAIFRHEAPDFDCLGAQFGLYHWLKANFPNKRIYVLGETKVEVGKNLFLSSDVICDDVLKQSPFLAIVLDTPNSRRISDQRYLWAQSIVKIDHHVQGEDFGELQFVHTDASATCELLYTIFRSKPFRRYPLSRESARFLYVGIVGDTGRFQFTNTTSYSLRVASELLKYNFDLQDEVYMPIYNKELNIFTVMKHILNHYVITEHGVSYYHLSAADLNELHISAEEGKNLSYLFNYSKAIKIWVAFAEDRENKVWRVSIRSRDIVVNRVAAHHRGGGHIHAAGARALTFAETLDIIKELEEEVLAIE